VAGQRKALIIANSTYQDAELRSLPAAAADAIELAQVLADPQIGGFGVVEVAENEPAHVIQVQVETLFSTAAPDDVVLVHFSCHGLKDESGDLYFAAHATRPALLGSTSVPASFVHRLMQRSRSRDIVLLLDCCYGGAFPAGVVARASGDVDVRASFPEQHSAGHGRVVISASDSMQFAFEGAQIAKGSRVMPSLFTAAVVEGLATGEADRDEDGWVSVSDLYEYVSDTVRQRNPRQTPVVSGDLAGRLYLARSKRQRIGVAPVPPNPRIASMLAELAGLILELNAAESMDGLAAAAAAGASRMFAVPATVMLELPDGQVRLTTAVPGTPGTGRRSAPPGMAERVAGYALGAGQTAAVTTLSQEQWLALLPASKLRADVCLAVARNKTGMPPVGIATDLAGLPGDDERKILRQLAQSVAYGMATLRSSAEDHLVALTLQRSLLPAALPTIPAMAMAYRYLPASEYAEVGGDFYEALTWENGLLVAIGEVQGEGGSLYAATVMSEVRHALRAFLSTEHSPTAVTGLLNQILQRFHPDVTATLCMLIADPESGKLTVVNCGHMPTLLVDDSGARYIGQGGEILGSAHHEPHVETATLPVGGTALLFTDGLVQDRQVALEDNLQKLRIASAEAADADVEAFANHVVSLFGPREDDVAIVAVRRTG